MDAHERRRRASRAGRSGSPGARSPPSGPRKATTRASGASSSGTAASATRRQLGGHRLGIGEHVGRRDREQPQLARAAPPPPDGRGREDGGQQAGELGEAPAPPAAAGGRRDRGRQVRGQQFCSAVGSARARSRAGSSRPRASGSATGVAAGDRPAQHRAPRGRAPAAAAARRRRGPRIPPSPRAPAVSAASRTQRRGLRRAARACRGAVPRRPDAPRAPPLPLGLAASGGDGFRRRRLIWVMVSRRSSVHDDLARRAASYKCIQRPGRPARWRAGITVPRGAHVRCVLALEPAQERRPELSRALADSRSGRGRNSCNAHRGE